MKQQQHAFQNTVAADLASGNPELQSSSLLAVIALMSAGRDVTAYVSVMCQCIVGNSSVPLDLRIKAYDIINASILSDADSQMLVQGILADLQLEPSPANEHVQASALAAMQRLPTHRLIAFVGDSKVAEVIRGHLRGGQPLARAAGAQSVATVMSFDTMMKLLAENKDLKDMFSNFVQNLSSMLLDPEPELTLGGARALTSLLGTMSLKVRKSVLTARRSKESSNYSKGLVLALSICEDAVVTVDGMFAEVLPRFRTLGPDAKRQILTFLVSYLDAKVLVYSLNTFDYRPGEILGHHSSGEPLVQSEAWHTEEGRLLQVQRDGLTTLDCATADGRTQDPRHDSLPRRQGVAGSTRVRILTMET